MKEMLEKLAGKHADDDDGAHAKMQVLHELRNMAMDMMGDKVRDKMPHEMHGVEVMAPDKESLQAGLGLAQHMTGPHDSETGPTGPSDEMSADKDEGYGEHLDSKMPGKLGHESMEQGPQMSGHGQPDRSHAMDPDSEHDDDMYGDMDDDELDQHIQHLQKLKQAKRSK